MCTSWGGGGEGSELKKPGFFSKKPNPVVFWGFWDKQDKIGKMIQKSSNLKP